MSDPVLADLVEVADVDGVVRLDAAGERLSELVLTGDVVGSLRAVLAASEAGRTGGAGLFVVGPFGSGKSHFLAAVGELLADPAAASRLPGWDPGLRRLAGAARPSLGVRVPLVDYRAGSPLEDVVADRAWKALGAPRSDAGWDRRATWGAFLREASERGHHGVLLLLDELSEFLRAKQGPALTEDLRFLQFLGEWAREAPVVVLAALQENIEEVANVSQRELARIRDRYQPSLTLSMRHVEDLVRGRLVRLRPGADAWVERAWAQTSAAFPATPVTEERFARCYPLHPETLSVLEGLRFVLSQQRGVVDFVCRRVAASLERPYHELITPDEVFDHFRGRLHERIETARYADTVVAYFERVAAELVDDTDVELALRAVKLLCLLAASPVERARAAADLAYMLRCRVSDLDPAANVSYLEQVVLSPLVAAGAYVVAQPGAGTGPGPGGGSGAAGGSGATTYTVRLDADASLVARARVAQARAELGPGDRRQVATLVELGSSPVLPLQLADEIGPSRRQVVWHNTARAVVVGTGRVAETTPDEARQLVARARAAGAEGFVLIGEVELDETGDTHRRAAALAVGAERLAVWTPDALRPEETEALAEIHCRRLVSAAAADEGRQDLVEVLSRRADADAAQAREILRRVYFEGAVAYPGGPATGGDRRGGVDLPSVAGLPFERLLAALADPLLAALHPRHGEVMPRMELVGGRVLRQLIEEVIAPGRVGAAGVARGQLRPLVEGFLAPLGIARVRADGLSVSPDPTRSPAVAETLRLVGDGEPVAATDVARDLSDGPLGLSEPETLLVLNACVRTGLLEAWRGRKRMTETFLALSPSDRLGPGELVETSVREAVAALSPITGPGPWEPWSAAVQEDAWRYASSWLEARREDLAQVRAGLARVEEVPALALAGADLGPVADDMAVVAAAVEALGSPGDRLASTSLPGVAADPFDGHPGEQRRELARRAAVPAARGLRSLVGALDDPGRLVDAARRVGALARFFRDGLRRVEEAAAYLTHPELAIPSAYPELETLRRQALGMLGETLRLAAEDRVAELMGSVRELRSAYLAAYQDGHDRFYSAVSPAEVDKVQATPAYRALAALSSIGALGVPDDRVKVDRLLAAAVPAPCHRRVDVELGWKPRCSCGYELGSPAPGFERDAAVAVAQQGVRQYLAELAGAETAARLADAASDLDALGRVELAGDLRRLLDLAADNLTADNLTAAGVAGDRSDGSVRAGPGAAESGDGERTAAAVSSLLSDDLVGVLGDVLSGGQLIVTRDLAALREDLIGRRYPKRRLLEVVAAWLDPAGDLPAGGFVEVLDSTDTAGRGGPGGDPSRGARSRAGVGPTDAEAPSAPATGIEAPGGAANARRTGAAPGSARRAGPGGANTSGTNTSSTNTSRTPASGTVALLAERFPGVAAMLPPHQGADAFWLAAWWAGRPNAPSWLPTGLVTDARRVGLAAEAARADPVALGELAGLDARVTADSVLGNQVSGALDLASRPAVAAAEVLADERLLRHPVRLALEQLLAKVPADWDLGRHLDTAADLASQHALIGPSETSAVAHLGAAAAHLGALERHLPVVSCRELVEELYPEHIAPVPALLSRAALASARGGSLVDPDAVEVVRTGAQRLLQMADATFAEHAERGFPGCMPVWEIGARVVAPLLAGHGRVAVLLVDAMRADLARSVVEMIAGTLPGRPVELRWAVVPEPTRTAESLAAMSSGRPVPAGSVPAHPDADEVAFANLGYEAVSLLHAERDHHADELHSLWVAGPPVSVAVATSVDERLHRTSVELAGLLDETVTTLGRRVVPSLAAIPAAVPLVVTADHGFREARNWGHGPEGRYRHGGTSLEECVVPVAVFGVSQPRGHADRPG